MLKKAIVNEYEEPGQNFPGGTQENHRRLRFLEFFFLRSTKDREFVAHLEDYQAFDKDSYISVWYVTEITPK
jgi:uncharacterized protein YijF (DUF1287 family)